MPAEVPNKGKGQCRLTQMSRDAAVPLRKKIHEISARQSSDGDGKLLSYYARVKESAAGNMSSTVLRLNTFDNFEVHPLRSFCSRGVGSVFFSSAQDAALAMRNMNSNVPLWTKDTCSGSSFSILVPVSAFNM